jgi:peptide/nickel transport system substrate-binding protein
MGITRGSMVGRERRVSAAWWLAAAALAIVLHTSACDRRTATLPSNYLAVDITTSPITLDPRVATDAISERVNELIYDALLRIDHQGNFTGDLAASFERPSPLAIVFHLRHGVHFSNGRLLTARDIAFTYASVLDPATLSVKRAGLTELASIQAADDYTVVMTTRRPYAPALGMGLLGIVPNGSPAPGRRTPSAPPGSGPFKLEGFVRDERVMLKRNQFHASVSGTISGVSLKVVPDATVRALELAEGICDFAENDAIQLDLLPWLAARPDLQIGRSPGTTYQYIIFNFRDSRLRDRRVRRALAYGIDRATIVHAMLKDAAQVATGMLTPQNWAYDGAVMRYPYDPTQARALLEAAGYGPAHPLRLAYKTTPEGRRLAETLQAMLRPLGLVLDIHANEWATFYSDLGRGNFAIAAGQWVGVIDPHQYEVIFASNQTPPHGSNRGAYSNPRMDQLLAAGDASIDPTVRKQIYAQVQTIAAEDLPYISLWWADTVTVTNRRLHGFEPYPNGSLASLADVTLTSPLQPSRP